jgi:hypothetical protein
MWCESTLLGRVVFEGGLAPQRSTKLSYVRCTAGFEPATSRVSDDNLERPAQENVPWASHGLKSGFRPGALPFRPPARTVKTMRAGRDSNPQVPVCQTITSNVRPTMLFGVVVVRWLDSRTRGGTGAGQHLVSLPDRSTLSQRPASRFELNGSQRTRAYRPAKYRGRNVSRDGNAAFATDGTPIPSHTTEPMTRSMMRLPGLSDISGSL